MSNINIEGTFFWPQLNRKDAMYDMYKITIGNLSDETVATLRGHGVVVSNKADKPEQGSYVVAKNRKDPIPAVDASRRPIPTDILIANGSKGSVSCFISKKQGYPNAGLIANSVMVTDLIEYVKDAPDAPEFETTEFEDIG